MQFPGTLWLVCSRGTEREPFFLEGFFVRPGPKTPFRFSVRFGVFPSSTHFQEQIVITIAFDQRAISAWDCFVQRLVFCFLVAPCSLVPRLGLIYPHCFDPSLFFSSISVDQGVIVTSSPRVNPITHKDWKMGSKDAFSTTQQSEKQRLNVGRAVCRPAGRNGGVVVTLSLGGRRQALHAFPPKLSRGPPCPRPL
jgi:hypothetical protein